ncbi:ATP-binding protein [Chitinophaga sedimenti]|uniref:sensor histidine kinase n=1 Tax=Chitinophaga sedimenti TaxID=2033606 RepID=UPI0020061A08|nr:ATP-binding protein [Chitinophaga sedimenti]MCK7558545.1 ATP-binding protein [Chitinophaga sedimenti]
MKRIFHKLESGKMVTPVYLFLLIYTIMALVWWGVLLFRQSAEITGYERENLAMRVDSLKRPMEYRLAEQRITKNEDLRTFKFIGEGAIFMIILLVGAWLVYRAIRKQLKLQQQQQNFMMAVTHELKSPIAAAKLNLETIRKRKLDEEKQHKLIDNTIRETNRLDQLCNNILLASQFENQRYQLYQEQVDLSSLVQAGTDEIAGRVTSHRIHSDIQPDIWVDADKFMLQIVLSNLVENAIKYVPKGTDIEVKLFEKDRLLKWQVIDAGPGIPADEKDRIFQKFYRIGNENTRSAKGSGLGLYLTRKIIEQHNGTIVVKDNAPAGTIFEITLGEYSVQSA